MMGKNKNKVKPAVKTSLSSRLGNKIFGHISFGQSFKIYMIVFLLVVLVLSMIQVSSMAEMQKNLRESYETSQRQASAYLDSFYNTATAIAEIVSNDPLLLSYSINNNLELPHNITQELDKIKSTYTNLASLGVIFTQSPYPDINNRIFASSGVYTLPEYARSECKNMILGDVLYRALVNTSSARFIYEKETDNDYLLFAVPRTNEFFPMYNKSVVLLNLNYSTFMNELHEAASAQGDVYVFDAENRLLLYAGSRYQNDIRAARLEQERGKDLFKDCVVFEGESNQYGVRVITAVNRDEFYRPLYHSIFSLCIILFMSLVAFFFVTYSFVYVAVRPVNRLMERSAEWGYTLSENGGSVNEFERLDEAFEQLIHQRQDLESQMYNEEQLVRNQFLTLLLEDGDYSHLNSKVVDKYVSQFRRAGMLFTTCKFMIDNYDEFLKDHSAKEQWMYKSSLCHLFEEQCREFGQGFAFEGRFGQGVVGIFICKEEKDIMACMVTICERVRKFMSEDAPFTLTCAVGQPCTKMDELPSSFVQTNSNLEYRFFQHNITLTSDNVRRLESSRRDTRGVPADKIIRAIKSGNAQEIEQQIDFALSSLNNMAAYHFTYFDIMALLRKMILELPGAQHEMLFYHLSTLYQAAFETIEDARAQLVAFCVELSKYYAQVVDKSQDSDLYSRILNYIKAHYASPDLSLSSISEDLSFTPSYLTRFFKEKQGISLMQYIDKLRFEKSKELLTSSNRPIKEIVEAVGYIDEANFSRKFKKYEGMSPTQYRILHRES